MSGCGGVEEDRLGHDGEGDWLGCGEVEGGLLFKVDSIIDPPKPTQPKH